MIILISWESISIKLNKNAIVLGLSLQDDAILVQAMIRAWVLENTYV